MGEGKIRWAELPELYVPFPPAMHEHADVLDRRTAEWLCNLKVLAGASSYRRFYNTRIGHLAARFHPTAPFDELQLITDWYGWMFFWDDQRDETEIGQHPDSLRSRNGRLLEILAGSERPENDPLAHALWDLRRRLVEKATSKEWMRRFTRSVEEHFDATVWEATNRSLGVIPDLESYIRMRPITGGLNVDTQFVEIAEHAYPPSDIWNNPILRRMSRASDNAVCWANDIYSLEKEIQRNDVHNLVLILHRAHGLTLQAAVRRAIEMHNSEVKVFVESISQLQPFDGFADMRLQRFVAILQARMRGFVDWAHESGRYRSAVSSAVPPAGGSL